MKIIGVTTNGFILESSRDEVANLLGFYSGYSEKAKVGELKSGAYIKVAEMYSQLYQLAGAKKKIVEAQKQLREVADRLDPLVPIIPVVLLTE